MNIVALRTVWSSFRFIRTLDKVRETQQELYRIYKKNQLTGFVAFVELDTVPESIVELPEAMTECYRMALQRIAGRDLPFVIVVEFIDGIGQAVLRGDAANYRRGRIVIERHRFEMISEELRGDWHQLEIGE